ncbi:MAG: hypothetical protein KDA41_13885 [Planctomycetales bacterium]|nr:hypothetical protein [Planctomycetales bacterium]
MEKSLDMLKFAQPECLQLAGRKDSSQRFAGLRAVQRMVNANDEKRRKGPMATAFVTRNPLLPKEFFAPEGVDKLVLDMNREVPNCLLDCPGAFSVRVASFRGNVVIDQKEIAEIENGRRMTTGLDVAAEKAHKLTEALRSRGVEAYEFPDRHESIVTVGSFDAVGTPRADGKIEINPAVLQVLNTYGAVEQSVGGGAAAPGLMPKSLAGVTFDVQPVPVEVPRRSIAADYARSR